MENLGKDEIVVGRYLIKTSKYYYTKDHVWALVKGNIAKIGITDYAQFQVDLIEQVELPRVGDYFEPEDVICRLQGVKGLFEVLSPLTGSVEEINSYVEDNPNIINEDPYEEGWILSLRLSDPLEIEDLLSPEDYIEYIKELVGEESENIQIIHEPEIEGSIEELPEENLGYEEQ